MCCFLMPNGKIVNQNPLNMMIPSGIGILHPDNLHLVSLTDGVLFPIPFLYNLVLKMLLPVKLDGKHRNLPAPLALVDYKIKTAGIKQVVMA